MSAEPPPNPYEHELPPERLRLSRRSAWLVTGVFLLMIGLPPLLHDVRELGRAPGERWLPVERLLAAVRGEDHAAQGLPERLKSFEAALAERVEFAKPLRQLAQGVMLRGLMVGNAKTVVGRKGWLFYRPEIRALTGNGPLLEEPASVAHDPALARWSPPLPAIGHFAAQLRERGVELWMVPVPMKESLYPEMLTGHRAAGPITHPQQSEVSAALAELGVRVFWLEQRFWEMKRQDATEGPVYLRQDTHWSTRAMQAAAAEVGAALQEKGWAAGSGEWPGVKLLAQSEGDLVEKLGVGEGFFAPETQLLSVVPAKSDEEAPLVLLGDSFVNIYDDPSLGFGSAPLSAGFAQHLMAASGAAFQVIAKNGGGATTVREQLARMPEEMLRRKKVVVWVLAARDLFMARSEAQANRVVWSPVTFQAPSAPVTNAAAEVEATVVAISDFPADPTTAPYANAVFCVKYHVERVIAGAPINGDIFVYHALFQKRQFLPAARVKPGGRYVLKLQAWDKSVPVFQQTVLDDFNNAQVQYAEAPTARP